MAVAWKKKFAKSSATLPKRKVLFIKVLGRELPHIFAESDSKKERKFRNSAVSSLKSRISQNDPPRHQCAIRANEGGSSSRSACMARSSTFLVRLDFDCHPFGNSIRTVPHA